MPKYGRAICDSTFCIDYAWKGLNSLQSLKSATRTFHTLVELNKFNRGDILTMDSQG